MILFIHIYFHLCNLLQQKQYTCQLHPSKVVSRLNCIRDKTITTERLKNQELRDLLAKVPGSVERDLDDKDELRWCHKVNDIPRDQVVRISFVALYLETACEGGTSTAPNLSRHGREDLAQLLLIGLTNDRSISNTFNVYLMNLVLQAAIKSTGLASTYMITRRCSCYRADENPTE